MWEEVNFKAFDPKTSSTNNIHIEGINSGGLLVSRAAEFAIVVEMQIIRNILLGKIHDYEKSSLAKNVETQVNFFTLSDMTFFNYKGREIVLLPPVMGAPLMECIVQNANSLGANYFVRLGTTGSLTTTIPKYSYIVTESSIRGDGTSDHYLPIGVPAVSDEDLNKKIISKLNDKKIPYIKGVSFTTETRFKEDVSYLLKLYKEQNVTNIEMESAALFSVATELGMRSSSLSMVSDCLADDELGGANSTLVGIPKYQELMNVGIDRLSSAFDAILEAFVEMPSNSKRFKEVARKIKELKQIS